MPVGQRSRITIPPQDAANGEFASAIETLVTAISLIKQSKVCMVLMALCLVMSDTVLSRLLEMTGVRF